MSAAVRTQVRRFRSDRTPGRAYAARETADGLHLIVDGEPVATMHREDAARLANAIKATLRAADSEMEKEPWRRDRSCEVTAMPEHDAVDLELTGCCDAPAGTCGVQLDADEALDVVEEIEAALGELATRRAIVAREDAKDEEDEEDDDEDEDDECGEVW